MLLTKLRVLFLLLLALPFCALAQNSVKGKVVDATTKESLVGVSVTSGKKSTLTGPDGSFSLNIDTATSVTLNYVGYIAKTVSAANGQNLGEISLTVNDVTMKAVVVTSNNVAIERKTPVAVTTIRAAQIEERIGNKEFPEVLRTAPSTYVTKSGGGFGDSRINVRGFTQNNTAVMINGVPVNDMENGRVFWSNWAGLSDIASNVQVQRGLGASRLSIGAVGGNINIVTKATEMEKGGQVGVTFGNDGYQKYTVGYSTGKGKNGLALSVLGSHTEGNGYVDGTAFSAWNYFATLGWEINSKHTITLTASGAPQWHHQRSGAIAYQTVAGNPNDPSIVERGIKYNDSWGYLNGKEYSWSRNFYHKPVANLNYYWDINDKTNLSAVVYASIGRGGGSSPFGGINRQSGFALPKDANGLIRFDDIVRWNTGKAVADFGTTTANRQNQPWATAGPYVGQYVGRGTSTATNVGLIRSASMNEHNWYGTILNLTHEITPAITLNGGIDLRDYKGLHYRKVDDLLGLNAWFDTRNVNNPANYALEDDNIDYNNDGLVKQYGGYLSGEYNKDKWSIFAAASASNTNYQRVDYFLYDVKGPLHESVKKNFFGYVTKAGANYRITEQHNVFANIGYFERAPFFNTVFTNNTNVDVAKDIRNEKIFSTEIGYGFRSKIVSVNVNAYSTQWKDKNFIRTFRDPETNQDFRANIKGLIADHKGVELEATSRPINKLEVSVMGSLGDWKYKNNVTTEITNDSGTPVDTINLYTKNLKVGDAAQTTANVSAAYEFFKGFKVRGSYYYAGNLYANFTPENREDSKLEGVQAWQLPSYGLVDAMLSYTFKLEQKRVTLRLNVDNLFDKEYIAESVDDTKYNPADTTDFEIGKNGSGKRNRVYMGFGRTWTIGAKVNF
jgi:outer membrane receptor protein involved in Fe transport